jgi:hypothetical protein
MAPALDHPAPIQRRSRRLELLVGGFEVPVKELFRTLEWNGYLLRHDPYEPAIRWR